MTFTRIGTAKDEALDLMVAITPPERFINRTARRLDYQPWGLSRTLHGLRQQLETGRI